MTLRMFDCSNIRTILYMVFSDMFYDLNGEDENKMETVIIDGVVYRIWEFTPYFKNEISDLVKKIDTSKWIKEQREPIVVRILNERNDINKIKINSDSDLLWFIRFTNLKIWEI